MRRAAIGVAAVGGLYLVWGTTPIRWDGVVDVRDGGAAALLATVAGIGGTAAGVLAGLLDFRRVRLGHTSTGPAAVIAFLAVSPFALWPMSVLVARFDPSDHEPFESSRVFEVCVGWLVYVALAYLLYWIVSGRAFRRARTDAPSPGKR